MTEDLIASYAQQRLWFLDRLQSHASLYNLSTAWQVEGVLDAEALEAALSELIRRHEVLRTTFAERSGKLLQLIHAPEATGIERLDVSAHDVAIEAARHAMAVHAQRKFDLAAGPLLSALLIKTSETQHCFQLTMHHIAADGWSMGIIADELRTLYGAFVRNEASPLAELPVQYADYAMWQRDWLQGAVLDDQLAYWCRALEGAPARLDLPLDRKRPAEASHRGAAVGIEFAPALLERLQRVCMQERVTAFMALATVFNILLQRYSRQDDICVGYPVAGRRRDEVRGLIGFFVNTLVLRTRVEPSLDFRALLAQVRDCVLDAASHEDLPFERLVEELRPERSLSWSPLFQVMFALNSASTGTSDSSGVAFSVMKPLTSIDAKFDLTLDLTEQDGRLYGAIEYSTDLFDKSTIERMIGHFKALLDAAFDSPATAIQDLPMLTPPEQAQILNEWNATAVAYPQERRLHELFEAQVARAPCALAVMFEAQQLSYGELNARANQLAGRLLELGVRSEALVGICLERGVDMIVALLAVLKAGGAYLPLDPDLPQRRLTYMLEDAAVAIVITQQSISDRLRTSPCPLFHIDADWPSVAHYSNADLALAGSSDGLAYCIYTSGSTGRPKGVLVSHRNVANLWSALASQVLGERRQLRRVALNSSLSFDASVQSIVQLLSGHAVVVLPAHVRTDSALLLQHLRQQQVDTFDCTPSQLTFLVGDPSFAAAAQHLDIVLVGGEALSPELWRVLQESSRIRFFNVYGPTECTVEAMACEITPARSNPSIGRPLANIQIHVLDRAGRLVPVGVPGELHIAGAGVARGYLDRPELTAASFCADPFSTIPGARMYRTGDLVRYMPDGSVEYLGRLDHQVKIRGFRIELGEIESALREHEAVRDVAIVVHQPSAGDQQLAAYVVARTREQACASDLREHLTMSLPAYMVPTAWVFMDALPLNSSGKLDRQSLPAPEASRAVLGTDYVAPRTPLERDIERVWIDVLKIDRVGIHDNFFSLGGHSLLVLIALSALKERLKREISARELFRFTTVATLAAHLEARAPARPGPPDHAPTLGAGAPQLRVDQRYLADLPRYLQSVALRHDVPGVVVGVYAGGARHVACAGFMDADLVEPMRADARFSIGCLMKLVTATVAMKLQEHGDLDIDQPISRLLPEFSDHERLSGDVITTRHLMTHMSGLENDLWRPVFDEEGRISLAGVHEGLHRICQPGTHAAYTSFTFVLLGALCERITGQRWQHLVDTTVLSPLGIGQQAYADTDICGYFTKPRSGKGRQRLVKERTRGASAADASDCSQFHWTAEELLRFAVEHLPDHGGRQSTLLAPRTREFMQREHARYDGVPDFRGFGLPWFQFFDGTVGHRGNGTGQHSHIRLVPELDLAIVILANQYPSQSLFDEIVQGLVTGLEEQRPPRRLDAVSPSEFDGHYVCRPTGMRIHVSSRDGGFDAAVSGADRDIVARMQPMQDSDWCLVSSADDALAGTATFLLSAADGAPQFLLLNRNMYERLEKH
jgi:amino acid adenylation domain-containing protein